ncbi:hypothetical protein GGI08_000804 [Coemansia sp. S2]|nr:hypothetical protein GGI08_000804 [Coemansia sp. S2]
MDTPLTVEKGVLLVCIYNMLDGASISEAEKVSFHQSLPVTGKELLATACEKFNYKGTSARLVKVEYTRSKISRERGTALRRSYVFHKDFHEYGSICLMLINVCPRPHYNLKAIERKTRQSVTMASEASEESEDYDELPEHVEMPFYNPSRKLGNNVDVLVDPIEALED